MKTISGEIVSSTPVTISKAASILSKFVSAETGASQAVNAYLRRATAAFDDLVILHSKSNRRKHKKHKLDASSAATTNERLTGGAEVSQGPNTRLVTEKKKVDFGSLVDDEGRAVSEVKEENSQGEGNVGEDADRRKKKKKKEKKDKGGNFGNSRDDGSRVGVNFNEEQSHGEDNLGEEIERKKLKKKKRDRDSAGNSEENGVEIGNREGEIKREIKEEEKTIDSIRKFEENGVKLENEEEKKEDGKKRKNREVEVESRDDAEEQPSKKKKKRRG